jgi:hypothetical protein
MGATNVKKLSQNSDYDIEEDAEDYVIRPPRSAIRYTRPPQRDTLDDVDIPKGPSIQRRRSAATPNTGNGMVSHAIAPSWPWRPAWLRNKRIALVAIIVGMLLMSLLVYAVSAFGSWWQIHQDDVTYGRPRTFQMDAVVGHGDSTANPSHFIFLNLNRHVIIIELPGGDATRSRIYNGPTLFGDGQDLTPVTAEFRDVNGDGKLDMIVHIQDQTLIFINDGTQFRPLQPGEHVNTGS